MRTHYQSFMILLSEWAWMYYLIFMITSAEWNEPAEFYPGGMVAAALVGYVVNRILTRIDSRITAMSVNLILVSLILYRNWQIILADGSFGLGIVTTLGAAALYGRGAYLVMEEPNRRQVLLHFEGNVLAYIVFSATFTVNQWVSPYFHIIFISGIILSLLGMMTTQQKDEAVNNRWSVKTIKVGSATWFAWSIALVFVAVPVLAMVFLMPGLNQQVTRFWTWIWNGGVRLFLIILHAIGRIFSLLPARDQELIPGESTQSGQSEYEAMQQIEEVFSFELLVLIIGAILLVCTLWLVSRYVMRQKAPARSVIHPVSNHRFWRRLQETIRIFLKKLRHGIMTRFPVFYKHPIFWRYQQVEQWGKQQKIVRRSSETTSEYLQRLAEQIPSEKRIVTWKGNIWDLRDMLIQLGKDYQSVYYHPMPTGYPADRYEGLIDYLKNLS